jgi:hypothetical protein
MSSVLEGQGRPQEAGWTDTIFTEVLTQVRHHYDGFHDRVARDPSGAQCNLGHHGHAY